MMNMSVRVLNPLMDTYIQNGCKERGECQRNRNNKNEIYQLFNHIFIQVLDESNNLTKLVETD